MLAETAESLARTARELKGISPDEWLTLEEAAACLKKTPKAFEKVQFGPLGTTHTHFCFRTSENLPAWCENLVEVLPRRLWRMYLGPR